MAKFGALNKVAQPKFYCTKNCGDPEFSIDELNKAYKYCDDAGVIGIERDKILSPELFPCTEQCERCINIVLDTKIESSQRAKERFIKLRKELDK